MRVFIVIAFFMAAAAWAQTPPAWVSKSNENAQLLIAIMARYAPEGAAAEGVQGLDEQVSTAASGERKRFRTDTMAAREELENRLTAEKDPLVRQDLEILIAQASRDIRQSEANERILLPYDDIPGLIFYGVKSLLDDQVVPNRRPAA
ncbi:MAG: DUF885 domain-containing protein, partial [Bryobacterales bacterium]|nr:DUF885 domain-containing protein [Bryobacterales bacterium]